jgi:hypothetical protein
MDPKYYEDRRSTDLLQCAGAAIFRANIGVDDLMPNFLLKQEVDEELVFSTSAELIAHHGQVPLFVAQVFLFEHPPTELLKRQLAAQGVSFIRAGS